ncbi:hypothetical protein DPM19_32205 [Actinomadura craniellae]|uniref:DUF5709 domain-containing protein n=1 Tax=Actinomadura craniellae TaxID=2231787 RepID=A0A365GWG3_9ACTN|nr:DUF5709 domain-containing protein [Actinomadura craniellae]RAY11167.1 hypothetical protein DPM19_32205 [Actinomadura craniellae]
MTERDPRSRLEDEGVPDLQDGTPEQAWAEDPQEMPLPGDEPVAVDEYGTTAEEQLAGEPLDLRLAREQPEPTVSDDDPELAWPRWQDEGEAAGRLVAEDEGAHPDREKDAVANDVGADGGGYTAEEEAVRIERPE